MVLFSKQGHQPDPSSHFEFRILNSFFIHTLLVYDFTKFLHLNDGLAVNSGRYIFLI